MDEMTENGTKVRDMLNLFKESGLHIELNRDIDSLEQHSIDSIFSTRSFISGREVISIINEIPYDPYDTLYVISRNDRTAGFWNQERKGIYLEKMRENAQCCKTGLNQVRIRVFSEYQDNTLMLNEDIYYSLIELHNVNTYFSISSVFLKDYKLIDDLIFGAIISKVHKFAIIPIPSHEQLRVHSLGINVPSDIGKLVSSFNNYNIDEGPLKAIITVDQDYILSLINEFEKMVGDSRLNKLK